MRGPFLALCFVSLSLCWLVFFGAGVRQTDWDAALLFLGATALFYWIFRSGQTPPPLAAWHFCALWALPMYAAFQLIPLSPATLEMFSPTRAALTGRLAAIIPNIARAPISVAPSAALAGFFSLLGYLTIFSLMRDLSWRYLEYRPWIPAAPLVGVAAVESAVGVAQWLSSTPSIAVRGTLANAEHFTALMEIALPFTLVFGFISFRRHQMQSESTWPAVLAACSWGASLLMLLALSHSTSQTSHVVLAVSLFVLIAFAIVPRLRTQLMRRYAFGGASFLALGACLIAAPPYDFVNSLANLGANQQTPADQRITIWTESSSLLDQFRWFGTGMGGFKSTFPKFQSSGNLDLIQNPHSDVLALLITFGIVGSIIVLIALIGVVRPAVIGAVVQSDEPRRLLAVSITASLAAIMIRACLESTLSAPVMATAFAWLAGLSQSSGLD